VHVAESDCFGLWQVIPSVKKEEAIRIYVEAQVEHVTTHSAYFVLFPNAFAILYLTCNTGADDGIVGHHRMHGGARRALRAAAQATANLCQN
jgi:hypothetical protein